MHHWAYCYGFAASPVTEIAIALRAAYNRPQLKRFTNLAAELAFSLRICGNY